MDKGVASNEARAGHEPSQQAVSAVPVTIANASGLLPCPTIWCTREESPHIWQGSDDKYCVICPSCSVNGPSDYVESEAVDAWNDRDQACG